MKAIDHLSRQIALQVNEAPIDISPRSDSDSLAKVGSPGHPAILHIDDDFGRLTPRRVKISEIAIPDFFATTHPDSPDEALVASIQEHGLLNPIAITPAPFVLVSGLMRLRVHEHLGMEMIDAIFVDAPRDRLRGYILEFDVRREIIIEERVRRFAGFFSIEQIKADERKRAGIHLGNSPQGSARDLAARKVNMDGRTAELGWRLVQVIDALEKTPANAKEVSILRKALNRSVNGALMTAYRRGLDIGWKPRAQKAKAIEQSDKSSCVQLSQEPEGKSLALLDSANEACGEEVELKWLASDAVRDAAAKLGIPAQRAEKVAEFLEEIRPALECYEDKCIGELLTSAAQVVTAMWAETLGEHAQSSQQPEATQQPAASSKDTKVGTPGHKPAKR